MTVRVVLVDDQALVRAGFKAIIDSAPDLEVVGEADDGAVAAEVIRDTRADVVLMDIRMPGQDGITTTRAITGDDDLAGRERRLDALQTSTARHRCPLGMR